MRKIGFFALALVLALGGLGIGYAEWTDTLTIDGTVNTGDVDINIVGYSGVKVYKMPDHGIEIVPWIDDWPTPPANSELIAFSGAGSAGDDSATFVWWNIFPSIDFYADILVRYDGSIPVRITDFVIETTDDWLLALIANNDASILAYESDISHTKGDLIGDAVGIQLHDGDYILIEIVIHLPQEDALMNQNASLTGTIEVIQWNEFDNQQGG